MTDDRLPLDRIEVPEDLPDTARLLDMLRESRDGEGKYSIAEFFGAIIATVGFLEQRIRALEQRQGS